MIYLAALHPLIPPALLAVATWAIWRTLADAFARR